MRFTVFSIFLVLFVNHTSADEWDRQLLGLDGVTITCANANKEKYAAKICDNMMSKIEKKLKETNISVAILGSYFIKSDPAPPKPEAIENSLDITVFLRATHSGGILAINIVTRISVTYERAIEKGSEDAGRTGELVLWETSTTGAGPKKRLPSAISKASMKKLNKQLIQVILAWPRL